MRLILLIFLLTFIGLLSQDRSEITISFNPIFENQPIPLEEVLYYNSNKDSLVIESLRFYISNIELMKDNEKTYAIEDSYYLIDLEQLKSLSFTLSVPSDVSYNTISFGIGIDSATNSKGVYGGALDPTNGMYWTWQSGYINFKLEGISDKCATRKNRFLYHLGGYQYPYNLYQMVELPLNSDNKNIEIEVDITELIQNLDLEKTNQIMSPSTNALNIAKLLPRIFKIKN